MYEKHDDPATATARLNVLRTVFIEADRTADFQTISSILRLLANDANRDDILALFEERMLPLDDVTAGQLADEVLSRPPLLGCLTISDALQWRLQYSRAIEQAGVAAGVLRLT